MLIFLLFMIVIILASNYIQADSRSILKEPSIVVESPPAAKRVKFKDIKTVRSYSTATGDIIDDRIATV